MIANVSSIVCSFIRKFTLESLDKYYIGNFRVFVVVFVVVMIMHGNLQETAICSSTIFMLDNLPLKSASVYM